MKINKLDFYILFICFYAPYFGLVPIAYGIIILRFVYKLLQKGINFKGIFSVLPILLVLALKFYQVDFLVFDALTRYYFGVVLFYFFLNKIDISINIEKFITIFFFAVFLESILINVFFDPFQYLPNYPKSVFENEIASHYTKFMGFYQRPYSIGMNASISSTIMVGLLLLNNTLDKKNNIIGNRKVELFGLLTIILLASGVGIGLYFIYLMFRLGLFSIRKILFGGSIFYLLTIYYDLLFTNLSEDNILQKVSYGYINFLYEYKVFQIEDFWNDLNLPNNSIWIGKAFESKGEIIIQSDFAWNDFLYCFGILGLTCYLFFVFSSLRKQNFFAISILLIGAFHYGGIFTISGQIVFASLLLINKKLIFNKSNELNN